MGIDQNLQHKFLHIHILYNCLCLNEKRCKRNWDKNQNTVWFFTFGIFYDDINSKVIKIFEFWKKVSESLWWCILWCATLWSFFFKNLYLLTYEEMLIKISKKHYDFKSSVEQLFLNLLLFPNEWSYWYQIGLKLKLIYSSFKKCKGGNFSLMVYHIGHEKIGLLMKIWIKSWFTAHKSI